MNKILSESMNTIQNKAQKYTVKRSTEYTETESLQKNRKELRQKANKTPKDNVGVVRRSRGWHCLCLYLWIREQLCRSILDLQSHAQAGHWEFAVVAGIEAAKWRRSLAHYVWWRRSSSCEDDATCVSVRQRCLSWAVTTSSVGGKPTLTVSLTHLQGQPCFLWPCSSSPNKLFWNAVILYPDHMACPTEAGLQQHRFDGDTVCSFKDFCVCNLVLPPYSKNRTKGTSIEPFKLFQVPPVNGPGFTTIQELWEDDSSVHFQFGVQGNIVMVQQPVAQTSQCLACFADSTCDLFIQGAITGDHAS